MDASLIAARLVCARLRLWARCHLWLVPTARGMAGKLRAPSTSTCRSFQLLKCLELSSARRCVDNRKDAMASQHKLPTPWPAWSLHPLSSAPSEGGCCFARGCCFVYSSRKARSKDGRRARACLLTAKPRWPPGMWSFGPWGLWPLDRTASAKKGSQEEGST